MTEDQCRKIFHDLKNDLAAMTSLINLHKLYKDRIYTEEMLNRLFERQTVISTTYEKLYQENNYPNINIRSFLLDLIQRESRTFNTYCSNIKIIKEIPDIVLSVKQAMPLAQILVELLSNSYRHAFEGITEGKQISFKISEEDNKLVLDYSDNGKGLPDGFEPRKSQTLGMQFIYSLSRQVGGQPAFLNDKPGVNFKLVI